ncbi:arylphorin subunit alpha-like [Colletes gigas]|uniref:arylphorin subunit alpha-like n=1 Tax=Colletes gigas TaxID=935657 RepID=UPI001C9A5B3D|nr:arylphorin subunit alpha-like [Colletes gigas]
MLKIALLVALCAVCTAQSMKVTGSHTADMDFLHKQKKIYELLLYVRQNDLIDAEFYNVGRNFNLESNIDMFQDKSAVQKFVWGYKQGILLSRNAIFSPFNSEQLQEMQALFELFTSAKDFQTFYKTASWARVYLNSGLFTTAFTVAVLYRNDCKYMRLPPIYEIYPNLFYASDVIQEAQNIKMARGVTGAPGVENAETYMIYANYTGAYMPRVNGEYKLDYFMEDVGLNAFYYYFRQVFPFWLSSKQSGIPPEIRGQFYYFVHKQLLARYNLERLSNDLGEIKDFDWYKPIHPGYYSTLTYSNGISIPQRNRYSSIPYYKYKHLKEINRLESRIMDAIDSGYFVDIQGKHVDIYTPKGLGMLANMIEGNVDSGNRRFYGMYDSLARDILGFSAEQTNRNKIIPSALQSYCTNMRDPAFYMLYKRIMTSFFRYKENQHSYTQSELQFPGVRIESVNVDKLTTFFDNCDTLVNSAVSVENLNRGVSFRLKARRLCLNYQPFNYRFTINSDKETKAVLRIFLGPAFDDITQTALYLTKYYKYFVEMDKFVVSLRPGSNNIDRHSTDSFMTMQDMTPSDIFIEKLKKAIGGSEPFMYSEREFGFVNRLSLPKGKPEGMPYKMFFFLSQHDESNVNAYEFPMFGKIMFDGKSLGFPLDRPVFGWNYTVPNMFMKDVNIYSVLDKEMKY